ncbi:MAG: GreA/GreB family elongation factor [Bdellovibrionales bacterium]|nr:GreA/GreB family elongation factor [Bdellovibrionales bacterium]
MDKAKLLDGLVQELLKQRNEEKDPAAIAELDQQILMLRFLPRKIYEPSDWIIPSSLLKLRLGQVTLFALIVPSYGGLITSWEGQALQLITPSSPLGEALVGKKQGDRVQVEIRGTHRTYEILEAT